MMRLAGGAAGAGTPKHHAAADAPDAPDTVRQIAARAAAALRAHAAERAKQARARIGCGEAKTEPH